LQLSIEPLRVKTQFVALAGLLRRPTTQATIR
jgi:hypothetical protein